jgi:hypothetical protein
MPADSMREAIDDALSPSPPRSFGMHRRWRARDDAEDVVRWTREIATASR